MAKRRAPTGGVGYRRGRSRRVTADVLPTTRYVESSALVAALLEHDAAARSSIRATGRRVTSALTLAEAGNLLMIGSRAKDQGDWMKAARGLIDSATVVFRAAEARNADALNEAGDRLVTACRNCHSQYKINLR